MWFRNKKFEDWCLSKESKTPKTSFVLEQFFVRKIRETQQASAVEHIPSLISEIVGQSSSQDVNLNDSGGATLENDKLSFSLPFRHQIPSVKEGASETPINYLDIKHGSVSVELIGAVIRGVRILTSEKIIFRKCNIGRISLGAHSQLILEDCNVGNLNVSTDRPVASLEVYGGVIHAVSCPAPGEKNPFGGNVSFVGVKFPVSKNESSLFQDKQHFHNLRHHLEELQNTFEAQKMRVWELKAEQGGEAFTNQIISWYQHLSSNYGLSPGRPLLLALGAYLLMAFLTFRYDLAVLDVRPPTKPEYYDVGWRKNLKDGVVKCLEIPNQVRICGNRARAFLLPAQHILNPFGIFGAQSLLVAKSSRTSVWFSIGGLLCDILIATSFLAIRKRFKLH